MDSSERDDAMEMPTKGSDEHQDARAVEGVSDTPAWPDDTPPEVRAEAERMAAQNLANAEALVAATPPLAEPGIYVCIHEHAGEHPVLGRLDHGQEYDYSQVTDAPTLAAIAACVESGLLEKV